MAMFGEEVTSLFTFVEAIINRLDGEFQWALNLAPPSLQE